MILATASTTSSVTPDVVQELHLATRHVDLIAIDGTARWSDLAAKTKTFDLGTLHADSMEFMVTPARVLANDKQVAGLIGDSLLKNYDVSADFGSNRLDLISPDHCAGKVIYWPASAVAVVPIHISNDGTATVDVTLDGVPVRARLTTAAENTTLTAKAAEDKFKLTSQSPDMAPTGHIDDHADATIYRHRFKTLDFEGVAASNVSVDILPDIIRSSLRNTKGFEPGLVNNIESRQPEMSLGMNVLKHLHIYIAYKEGQLYITPANPPQSIPKTN